MISYGCFNENCLGLMYDKLVLDRVKIFVYKDKISFLDFNTIKIDSAIQKSGIV